jgi:Domain of unknown function (DUF4262)
MSNLPYRKYREYRKFGRSVPEYQFPVFPGFPVVNFEPDRTTIRKENLHKPAPITRPDLKAIEVKEERAPPDHELIGQSAPAGCGQNRRWKMGTMTQQREFQGRTEEDIQIHGRSIVCVFPSETETSTSPNDYFAYTIGNARRGLPELLIIGTTRDGYILNPLSEMMIERGQKFADGEMVECGRKFPFCLIDANETVKDSYTIQAGEHYGSQDYAVMQVVIPDRDGHFPWQPKCAAPFSLIATHRRV